MTPTGGPRRPSQLSRGKRRLTPVVASVRAELGIDDGTVVVGLIARVDPQKDHGNFIAAAARIALRRPEVRFLLCGQGTGRGQRHFKSGQTSGADLHFRRRAAHLAHRGPRL